MNGKITIILIAALLIAVPGIMALQQSDADDEYLEYAGVILTSEIDYGDYEDQRDKVDAWYPRNTIAQVTLYKYPEADWIEFCISNQDTWYWITIDLEGTPLHGVPEGTPPVYAGDNPKLNLVPIEGDDRIAPGQECHSKLTFKEVVNGPIWSVDITYIFTDGDILTFDLNYEGQPTPKQTRSQTDGSNYNLIDDPVREGYIFDGWYANTECTGDEVTSETTYHSGDPLTLYAKWLECIEKPEGVDWEYNKTVRTGVASGTGYTLSGTYQATDANVGSAKYTATATLDSGYIWSDGFDDPIDIEWTISPKDVTIVVDDKTKTYGQADPTFTGTVTGLVDQGDLGTITYGRIPADFGKEDVGASIQIGVSYMSNTNYSIAVTQGHLTIEKASISPVVSIDGWTYGESANAPSVSIGNPGGGAVTYKYKAKAAPESAYSGTVPTHAGEYTVKATVAETDNYLGGEDTEDFTISKVALSITADDKSVTYGEAAPTYTATFVGLVAGDTQSAITGLTLTCGYSAGSNAGSYTITASGGTSSDYEITHYNGTLTVNKVVLAIPTASSTVFTYNGSEQTYTPVGFATATMSKSNDKRTNAGSQTVSVSIKDTTNYVWSDDSSTAKTYDFTIGKAALTIKADDKSVRYGDAVPTYTATFTGLKGSDTQSVVTGLIYTCEYSPASDIGTYVIVPSDGTAANYVISYQNGTLTVSKKQIAIPTTVETPFTYNGSEQTYTPVGFDSSTMEKSNDKRTDAGSQTVSVSLKDTEHCEWTDSTTTAKTFAFSIGKADLKIKADDKQVVFGSSAPEYTATFTGLKGSDTKDVVTGLKISCPYTEESPVGEYTITPSAGTAANYTIAYENGKLTVTPNPEVKHTVSFDTKGGSSVASQEVSDGASAVRPADPTKSPTSSYTYTFAGWYADDGCTVVYDFGTPVTADITVYAKWDQHKSGGGGGGGGNPPKPYVPEKEEKILPDGSKEVIETLEYDDAAGNHVKEVTDTITDKDGKFVTKTEYKEETRKTSSGTVTNETSKTVNADKSSSQYRGTVTKDNSGKATDININYTGTRADGSTYGSYIFGDADAVEMTSTSMEAKDLEPVIKLAEEMGSKSRILVDPTGDLSMPSETLKMLAKEGYMFLVGPESCNATLDVATVKGLASQGGDLEIIVVKAVPAELTEEQKAVIGDNYAVEVILLLNGQQVHQLGGKATISVEPGYEALYVYYVAEDGSVEEVAVSYDPETGKAVFDVDHFSVYMVSAVPYEKPAGSDSAILYIAIAALIILAIVLFLIFYRARRRDRD